jgi:hypothetical protein
MASATNSKQLFISVIKLSSYLTLAIAALGSTIGWLLAGSNGLTSALIGAGLTLIFSTMTALSVYFGGKLSLGVFFGLVMGGWLVKLVVFMAIVAVLKNAVFINGPVLFFTLVASILGTLAIDAVSVTRSRIPSFTN